MRKQQKTVRKYRLTLDLQLFSEDPGVEVVPAAGEQTEQVENTQTGDEKAAAEPGKEDVAFSKRLSAAEKKWQDDKEAEIQKIKDEYKDHDLYRKATEYLQKTSGIPDMMTLKETIELEELQERADRENVSPETLKRIDELEAKAKRGEELEATISQEKAAAEFEQSLKTFSEGKEIGGAPLDYKELWNYMHENEIAKPDVAFKAMKADILEQKLATAKDDAVKDYLSSKRGVKTEGSTGATAQTLPPTGGGFKGAEARAIARVAASRTAE